MPIADLEEDRPGIADEVALGVTYREIDDYLEGKEVSAKLKKPLKIGGVKVNTNAICQSLFLTIFGNKEENMIYD